MKDNFNRNSSHINSLDDNYRQQEQNWGQQPHNYIDLKNEITPTVTNHTNKLINDLEIKYQQMNKRMEKRQEEALEIVFDKLDKTLENIQRHIQKLIQEHITNISLITEIQITS